MKDQRHYAGRFSAEVDRILEQHGRAEEQGPAPEYPALLTLAEQLAAIDPSQHTPLRPRLRAELLHRPPLRGGVDRQIFDGIVLDVVTSITASGHGTPVRAPEIPAAVCAFANFVATFMHTSVMPRAQ